MSKRTAENTEESCKIKKSKLLVEDEHVKELSLLEEVAKNGALLKNKGKSLRARCCRYLDDKKKAENSSNHKTIGDDFIANTNRYYFENGLRKVKPYFYTFDTFAKGRWLGRSLRDIYSKEFRLYSIDCYEQAAKCGNFLVNLEKINSLDYIVKNNDLISSKVHRHEGPVTASKIDVLVDNDKYLVVNKPSGMPIHPCSRYRDNTLVYILAKENKLKNIYVCHRIDLLTSGLCIFARSSKVSRELSLQISQREVQKEYLCKVVGVFPQGETVVCEAPITQVSHKLGYVCAWEVAGMQSKEAKTEFVQVSTDGETSVVRCFPKTGRTHQIRAHLQYLGYPIVNDPIYNHSAWGDSRFRHGPCDRKLDEVVERIVTEWQDKTPVEQKAERKIEESSKNDPNFYPNCPECVNPLPDPKPEHLVMYLHAHKYKGDGWSFESPMPEWCG